MADETEVHAEDAPAEEHAEPAAEEHAVDAHAEEPKVDWFAEVKAAAHKMLAAHSHLRDDPNIKGVNLAHVDEAASHLSDTLNKAG